MSNFTFILLSKKYAHMSKTCPHCLKEWPDEFKNCPIDGTALVARTETQHQGFNLNLGDANAISGGLNLTDSHAITNTTDSHNVITNYITHVDRSKSAEEKMRENLDTFREACHKVFSDGMCTSENKRFLDELKFKLGIDDDTASNVFDDARSNVQRKSTTLGPIQKITFQNVKTAIHTNNMDKVRKLYPQLSAMAQRFAIEEIQYTYYMLQSIIDARQCIRDYESHKDDKYWQTFWASIAYRKVGDVAQSESLLTDVGSKWTDTVPEENSFILAAVCAILDNDLATAREMYSQVAGGQSPFLEHLAGCLYGLLYSEFASSDELQAMVKYGAFYREQLFPSFRMVATCLEIESGTEEDAASNTPEVEYSSNDLDSFEDNKKMETASSASRPGIIVEDKVQAKEEPDVISTCTDDFGYLRKLSMEELPSVKAKLLALPENSYKAKFMLGQLYLQENDSAINNKIAYDLLKTAYEHGIPEAGAFMAYFYTYGKVVSTDLSEAERRMELEVDYKSIPFYVHLMVDIFKQRNNTVLASIWEQKLQKITNK